MDENDDTKMAGPPNMIADEAMIKATSWVCKNCEAVYHFHPAEPFPDRCEKCGWINADLPHLKHDK